MMMWTYENPEGSFEIQNTKFKTRDLRYEIRDSTFGYCKFEKAIDDKKKGGRQGKVTKNWQWKINVIN